MASLLAVVAVSSVAVGLPGCDDHLIRLGAGPSNPDAADAGQGTDAGIDSATSDGATSCTTHAAVAADEVLWIGDSWMGPGVQETAVLDHARLIGAIGPNDDYTVTAMPGARMSDIASQYYMQEAISTKFKVLIMDGGTIDTIAAQGSDASVAAVVTMQANTFTPSLLTIKVGQSILFDFPADQHNVIFAARTR